VTTFFDSKENALAMACVYTGVTKTALEGIVPEREIMYHPLDDEHKYPEEIEIYTFKNKDGEDVSFGIGEFRNGVDLWVIAKNGMMMRL
jgi:hypothetical protein